MDVDNAVQLFMRCFAFVTYHPSSMCYLIVIYIRLLYKSNRYDFINTMLISCKVNNFYL